ncbi:MAG: M15 family metallopeptidase [Micrococcales bacterium]|nr:M15 family metallopeptidase [Micrococcales bacterium]MCL2667247.1 M15 family metallopeptidase [Micrococcales bacterium]
MNDFMGVVGIQTRMAEIRQMVSPQTAPTQTATLDFASTLRSVMDTDTTGSAMSALAGMYGSSGISAGKYDASSWPTVSSDGTYRVPKAGSGRLDPSTLSQVSWAPSGTKLRSDAAQALEQLDAAFYSRFGEHLKVSGAGAYRDYDAQVSLRASKGGMAAEPGKSNHGWGLAVDINNLGGEGSVKHAWLRANAPAYGWDHPSWARVGGSKPESWHWEYVR